MLPTRLQIKTRFLALLDDPTAAKYTAALFTEAFNESYDALFQAFVINQLPRIKTITEYTLVANTTSLTPAQAGISNFGDIDELEERASGSSDKYLEVHRVDKLPQRNAADRLGEFVWRLDTFYFVGATTARQLRISSDSSGIAPTGDGDVVAVDGSLSFLARGAVAAIGDAYGDDEIAERNRLIAYGPKYNLGIIGGELLRLITAPIRSRQNVRVAPMPYGVGWSQVRRRVPYIVAQQPQGVATAPAQFTNNDGTVTGTIDGSNATFYLTYPVSTVIVILNGATLTSGVHYTHSANQIVFLAPFIPQLGADILVHGWL